MGILKHAVLPFFAVVHLAGSAMYLSGNIDSMATNSKMPGYEEERTPIELHFMSAIGGFFLMMFFTCVVAIFYENSHFRGIVAIQHLIFFGNDAFDYWRRDGFDATPIIVLALVSLVGVVIHSREPGFFTKDKKKTKAK